MAAKAHARREIRGRRRWRVAAITVTVIVVAAGGAAGIAYALTGSSSPTKAHVAGSASTTAKPPSVKLNIQPTDGATDLPLDAVVTVTTDMGRLTSVQVTSAGGAGASGSSASASAARAAVVGALDSTGQTWQSTGGLAPHTEYTVTVQAVSPSGQSVQQVSHFGTLAPKALLGVSLFPGDGLTVGIGQPIKLTFNHSVKNKDAILGRLQVTESTPVAGGWHWFSDRELHFRPQQYWPTGEQITLVANLAGFDAGNGIWATTDHSLHFAIGDAHVSTANVATDQMTVTSNGQVVGTYPLSAGRTSLPTMGGVHIALYRQYDVRMVSTTPGDSYDEHVFWDVNITDGGEFVHAAPWSTGAQGRSNVSHGCVNLSVANATAFFNFSRVGDIIQVVGSPRPPSGGDHGTMDWTTPWDQWIPAATPGAQAPPPAGVA